MPRHLLALTLTLAAAGCTPPGSPGPCAPFRTDSNADEPCREQLYFPSGIAMDPDGDVLYATSYNADLRYSGGVVHSLDVVHFECVLDFARTGKVAPGCDTAALSSTDAATINNLTTLCPLFNADPKLDKRLPIATTTVLAAEAACCTFDLLDPNIIECDERPFMTSAVKTGNFVGTIRVQRPPATITTTVALPGTACPAGTTPAGDGVTCTGPAPHDRRLWVPVRGDGSITWIDADKPYFGSKASDPVPSVARLSCEDPANTSHGVLLDSCNAQRITVRDVHDPAHPDGTCTQDFDCLQGSTCDGSSHLCTTLPIPADPFGLWLDEGRDGGARYSHLLVTHLQGGEVTLINSGAFHPVSNAQTSNANLPQLPQPTESVVLDVRGNFFNADASGRRGGFAIAPLTPGDAQSFWFVTSRLNPLVGMFRVAQSNLILQSVGFSVAGGPYSAGDDVRDVQVQPDGTRAFFIDNHPPTLFTLDTRQLLQGGAPVGTPTSQVVDVVDVCQGPSHLQLRQLLVSGAPGEPPALATRLFAVCLTTGQVWAVDPDRSTVTAQISVGRGPNDIAFNFPNPRRATAAHCSNGKLDPPVDPGDFASGESDVDCGGECARCAVGKSCRVSDDCASGSCRDASGPCEGDRACTCQPPPTPRAYVTNFTDSTIAVIDLAPGSSTENRVIGRIGITSPPFNQ
jgi:hypothetical protein